MCFNAVVFIGFPVLYQLHGGVMPLRAGRRPLRKESRPLTTDKTQGHGIIQVSTRV